MKCQYEQKIFQQIFDNMMTMGNKMNFTAKFIVVFKFILNFEFSR